MSLARSRASPAQSSAKEQITAKQRAWESQLDAILTKVEYVQASTPDAFSSSFRAHRPDLLLAHPHARCVRVASARPTDPHDLTLRLLVFAPHVPLLARSAQFRLFFAQMGCEGKVTLEKPANFEQWELQIWVKYRSFTCACACTSQANTMPARPHTRDAFVCT